MEKCNLVRSSPQSSPQKLEKEIKLEFFMPVKLNYRLIRV